jgi:hypothetical protein
MGIGKEEGSLILIGFQKKEEGRRRTKTWKCFFYFGLLILLFEFMHINFVLSNEEQYEYCFAF